MNGPNSDSCLFCGEPALVEVLEYWAEDRSFLLDTCCESMHAFAIEALPTLDRRQRNEWFALSTGERIRQIITSSHECPTWTVDQGLSLCDVEWAGAKEFVRAHHRHNSPPAGWKYGAGLTSGAELVAVMMAGRPCARNIDPRKVIKVTRICVKDLIPRELGWNACSMLYGRARKEARRRDYEHVITYTRLDEPGTSPLAAGFTRDGLTKGGSWHRKSRPRPNAPEPCIKQRWRRELGAASTRLPDNSCSRKLLNRNQLFPSHQPAAKPCAICGPIQHARF